MAITEHHPFTADQFVDQHFIDLDLSGATIADCEFDGCVFRNVILTSAAIRRTRFSECTFTACDLSLVDPVDSHFSDCTFEDCRLAGINWSISVRREAAIHEPNTFSRCDLALSTLSELELDGYRFVECRLTESEFRDARLIDSYFERTDLTGADFSNADLSGATLIECSGLRLDPTITKLAGTTVSAVNALQIAEALGLIIYQPES